MDEYQNLLNLDNAFTYATEYSCTITEPLKRTLKKQLSNDMLDVFLMGIPDGISPYVNSALIPKNIARRLYIFSSRPLDNKTLRQIELFVLTKPYPYPQMYVTSDCPNQPTHNFFISQTRHYKCQIFQHLLNTDILVSDLHMLICYINLY